MLLSNCKCSILIWISEQLLLVATGNGYYSGNDRTNQSQVIDLNSPTICSNLQPFPYAIDGGAGGVLNGHPTICGGQVNSKCKKQ